MNTINIYNILDILTMLNQQVQSEQTREQRMLDKANFLVQNKRVRRSPCAESRNMWMVLSYSTPKKWYVVKWNEELGLLVCDCPHFSHRVETCKHILACAIYEGISSEKA